MRVQLPSDTTIPTHVALLPADYSVDIPKERVDLARAALVSELRNHNYIVADPGVVANVCSSPQCQERARLASEYMVEGFVTLTLDSFSKNSFLAGYYNQLSGTLSVSSTQGQQIFAVDHTQSERGGLLFNSGQVLQGIISQVKNTGDEAYQDLAAKFAQTIVDQLPAPRIAETRAASEPADLVLTSVVTQRNGPDSYSVCAQGTPRSFGSVLIGTQRTNLREVSPGRYCAIFPALVALPESSVAYVELRTAYGNSQRERLSIPSLPPCSLDGRLRSDGGAVTLDCATVARDGSRGGAGCSEVVRPCQLEKIVLFRSDGEGGLYKKVGESRASLINVPPQGGDYEALAVSTTGLPSLATRVQVKSEGAAK